MSGRWHFGGTCIQALSGIVAVLWHCVALSSHKELARLGRDEIETGLWMVFMDERCLN